MKPAEGEELLLSLFEASRLMKLSMVELDRRLHASEVVRWCSFEASLRSSRLVAVRRVGMEPA